MGEGWMEEVWIAVCPVNYFIWDGYSAFFFLSGLDLRHGYKG